MPSKLRRAGAVSGPEKKDMGGELRYFRFGQEHRLQGLRPIQAPEKKKKRKKAERKNAFKLRGANGEEERYGGVAGPPLWSRTRRKKKSKERPISSVTRPLKEQWFGNRKSKSAPGGKKEPRKRAEQSQEEGAKRKGVKARGHGSKGERGGPLEEKVVGPYRKSVGSHYWKRCQGQNSFCTSQRSGGHKRS